jgi:Mce-associated membrane protein
VRQRPRVTLLALLTVAVLAFAGYSGWTYRDAANAEALTYGKQREEALEASRTQVATLNSIDTKNIKQGLTAWQNATTGKLQDQLKREQSKSESTLRSAGTTAQATVTDAAVTELDARAGTAKVIATVRVVTTGSREATDRKRFEAGLNRTGDGWRLASLTAITVGGGEQ